MTDESKEILSLFETSKNKTNLTSESTYSVAGALLLSGKWMNDWWEISLSIFLWMTLSFMNLPQHAARIEKAVFDAIADGRAKTGDLGGSGTCSSFTADVCARVKDLA